MNQPSYKALMELYEACHLVNASWDQDGAHTIWYNALNKCNLESENVGRVMPCPTCSGSGVYNPDAMQPGSIAWHSQVKTPMPRTDGCGGRCGAFAVADGAQCELENDHEGEHRIRCIGRSRCWGDNYACAECSEPIFTTEQVMARFDNLIERIKDIHSGMVALSPNIHQMPPSKK